MFQVSNGGMMFNHAMTLAFTALTEHEKAEDLTYQQFRDAVLQRVDALDPARNDFGYLEEYKEAVLPPYDTFEEA